MLLDDLQLSIPAFYPYMLDLKRRAILLCPMTAETYKASSFLDVRIVRAGSDEHWLTLDQIYSLPPQHSIPTYYIFHSAFGCSTLFSRYLDLFDQFLVLREPHLLFELISLERFRKTDLLPPMAIDDWQYTFEYVIHLLTRRWNKDHPVINKPTDGVNNKMAFLIGKNPVNRAIFLYSSLERFLTAVLKYPHRDEWAKMRAREFTMDQYNETGRIDFDPATLNRSQTATLVWVRQMKFYQSTLQQPQGHQICCLDSEDFMRDPAAAITAFLDHINHSINPDLVRQTIDSSIQTSNAKAGEEPYSVQQREDDFRIARQKFSPEIDAGIDWAIHHYGSSIVNDRPESPLTVSTTKSC